MSLFSTLLSASGRESHLRNIGNVPTEPPASDLNSNIHTLMASSLIWLCSLFAYQWLPMGPSSFIGNQDFWDTVVIVTSQHGGHKMPILLEVYFRWTSEMSCLFRKRTDFIKTGQQLNHHQKLIWETIRNSSTKDVLGYMSLVTVVSWCVT